MTSLKKFRSIKKKEFNFKKMQELQAHLKIVEDIDRNNKKMDTIINNMISNKNYTYDNFSKLDELSADQDALKEKLTHFLKKNRNILSLVLRDDSSNNADSIKLDLDKKLHLIEDEIKNINYAFITDNDYKLMMESILKCIKEIDEISSKNENLALEAETLTEKALNLFLGEICIDGLPYGAERLKKIFTWLSDRFENNIKITNKFHENKDIYLLQKIYWKDVVSWLNDLRNEHPFSSEENRMLLDSCVGIGNVALYFYTGILQQIHDLDICISMLKKLKFYFPHLETIKNIIPQLESEKYFTDNKVIINSSDLTYLENTFIDKYEKVFNMLSEIPNLNKSAAPYIIRFMKSGMAACKHIVDSLHSINVQSDPVMKQKINLIKNKILGFYDNASALYKIGCKDHHAWIDDFNNFLYTLNNCSEHFKNKNTSDFMALIQEAAPFVKSYMIFWKLENNQQIKNKLNDCLKVLAEIERWN